MCCHYGTATVHGGKSAESTCSHVVEFSLSLYVVAPPLSVDSVAAVLEVFAEKWRDVGQDLYIPQAALGVIQGDFDSDLDRLRGVILYWILRCPYASWRYLIWNLGLSYDEDLNQVADNIREFASKLSGT